MTIKSSMDVSKDSDSLFALSKEVDSYIKNGKPGGFIHVSFDNLPMIISSLGGKFADNLMNNIVKDLPEILEPNSLVFRTSKSEINVIITGCSPTKIDDVAVVIHNFIQNYGSINSPEPIHITATLGGVGFPKTAKDAKDAINKSYIALSEAKESHKRYARYKDNKKHALKSKNQMILASYIQNAFLNDKLCLAFQPIVSCKTGEVAYYESLLRIVTDEGNISSAGPFIPIAEKMGFIDVIDSLSLKMAVDELKKNKEIYLSVNVSNASMYDEKWLAMAKKMLSDKNVTSRLIIEITETSEQHDMKKAISFVEAIRELGCQVALDDFGTGYTSFSQVKNLPVNIIKIDGSFVKDIMSNEENKFFVKTLLEFSKNLGLKTVAEFVENQEIAEMLTDMGMDYMQGNYFSPAVNYRDWT